jgi:hypothetical protein
MARRGRHCELCFPVLVIQFAGSLQSRLLESWAACDAFLAKLRSVHGPFKISLAEAKRTSIPSWVLPLALELLMPMQLRNTPQAFMMQLIIHFKPSVKAEQPVILCQHCILIEEKVEDRF